MMFGWHYDDGSSRAGVVLDLVVPFRGDWHPVAVAWMFLHKLSLPAWIFATIHLLAAGADATTRR